jgi:hypothetical protein
MAETNNTIPVDIIADDTEVTITITNTLYKRIQSLIFHGLPFKDMEHFLKVCKFIQNGDFKSDPLCTHLETCLVISNLFEKSAKEQGKVIKKKFNLDTKKVEEVS